MSPAPRRCRSVPEARRLPSAARGSWRARVLRAWATIRAVRRWITALLCLLSLALPLQGLAAAGPVIAFGAMHDAAPSAGDPATASAQDTHAAAHPCHGSGTAGDEAQDTPPGRHAGCAQCAVCHAGSAPAPAMLAAPGLRPGAAGVPRWDPPHWIAVDAGGLDRPPRSHLA